MNTKIKQRILYSLLISLLIHLGFLVWSFFLKILPNTRMLENPEKRIHVKLAKRELPEQESQQIDTKVSEKSPAPENPFAETKAFQTSFEPKETVVDTIESAVQNKTEVPVASLPQKVEKFRKTEINDVLTSKKVIRSTRKNLVEVGEIPQTDFNSGQPVLISGENISKDFLDVSQQSIKSLPSAPSQSAAGQNEFQLMKKGNVVSSRKIKTVDMGTALVYELSKYQDPQSNQKYFKLAVKVHEAAINFPVIPKEIIFLVDASQSIGEERLKQFAQGLIYSLNHLNSNDRFNITVFKDKTILFSPESLEPEVDNIKRAISFLNNLKSGGRTDVFNALRTSITLQNTFDPSYRVLLSDGLPTTGIVNSSQVINEVSKINDGKVSIFAFSGGVNVSPYMMDFIAYKNRGWSRSVDREYFIAKEFSKMYDQIKDPLLLKLRYHVSGLKEKEVFPQVLPDFFKGSEFVIYGTFLEENRFFVQLLGNILGETKEFVVDASLQDAIVADKEIARQWAFHKVYHLIGQLKYNENNEPLLREINDLCSQFGIVTPYSSNFQELPKPKAPSKPNEPVSFLPAVDKSAQSQQNFTGLRINNRR